MRVFFEEGFAPYIVICRREDWRTISCPEGRLTEDDAAYLLAVFHESCYIVHEIHGLVTARLALEDAETFRVTEAKKFLSPGQRDAFRLHEGHDVFLEDADAVPVDVSAGGCRLRSSDDKPGTARLLTWRLSSGDVVETVAVCVHRDADGGSGWRFLAWRKGGERLFRLPGREVVPPFACHIQRRMARHQAIMPPRKR